MKLHSVFLFCIVVATIVSYRGAADRTLWFLEAAPALVGTLLLCLTYTWYGWSNLSYALITLSFLMMLLGAHYTYAEVPTFNWLKEEWGLQRNYYDRVGHFVQGVVPAIMLREVCVRNGMMQQNKWLILSLIVGTSMGLSALYEIVEMGAAFIFGSGGTIESFLGFQGDGWDTQQDMLMAALGAILSIAVLSKLHDISIKKIGQNS